MAIRQIRIEGDPILRKKTREVSKVDDRIITILNDMEDTLYDADGLGLAAPQVGILRKIVVIDMRDGNGIIKMINPNIIEKSGKLQLNTEGCLSVPEKSGYVRRPENLTVEYLDESGERHSMYCEGYKAVCVSHELDHLDGILYIDKIAELSDEEIEFIEEENQEENYE